MTETNARVSSSGIGFCGLLTIVFIALKLTGHVEWSWVWVLSPLWIPSVVCLIVFLFMFFVLKRLKKMFRM